MKPMVIGVAPEQEYQRLRACFDAVGTLTNTQFVARSGTHEVTGICALIVLRGDREEAVGAAEQGIPCYAVFEDPGISPAEEQHNSITFQSDTALPPALRGKRLRNEEVLQLGALPFQPGDTCLAASGERPLWAMKRTRSGAAAHFAALSPPVLEKDGFLHHQFNGRCFLRLLLLMGFIESLRQSAMDTLRACLIFDDPNLASKSYGYLHYPALLEATIRHNFHACVATIPIDAHRTSPETAALFRDNPQQLSIAIHGNNHTKLELAVARQPTDWDRLLAQALQRVRAMEKRHRLTVSPVMEPPYGVVNAEISGHLRKLGYEGILITTEQHLRRNPGAPYAPTFGMDTPACLPDGTAIIPRCLMSPRAETEAVLAAFLGQPLVFAGHHQDASNGLASVIRLADTINSLGAVRWQSPAGLVHSNFAVNSSTTGLITVKLASRHCVLEIREKGPIQIERLWMGDEEQAPLEVHRPCGKTETTVCGRVAAVDLTRGSTEIISPSPLSKPVHASAAQLQAIWPLLRKRMMESRDRLGPLLNTAPRGTDD